MRSTQRAVLCFSAVAALSLTFFGAFDRPATASARADAPFAVVDAIGLLEQMLQSPELQAARDETRGKYEQQMTNLQTSNAALANMLQNMDQADPAFQVNVNTYQNQQYQMQELGNQFAAELDVVATQQATEIYQKITEAVNAVADREGIDNVISNRVMPGEAEVNGLAGVTQQILARPVMRTNAVDLTVAVRDELGLPDPAIAAAEAAEAEARRAARADEINNLINSETDADETPAAPAAEEGAADDEDASADAGEG
ncbi:MAG: Skp family chaperone for outer membrane protein [Phycisphaerales bacterium]